MKNIIKCALYLLIVPVLFISFNSCGNVASVQEVQDQPDNVTIEYSETYVARTTGIHYTGDTEDSHDGETGTGTGTDGPTPDCEFEDCSTAIPAMGAILQQIANENCQEVWNCIACCMDGGIVYALMYAKPQSPPCPVIAEPADLEHY